MHSIEDNYRHYEKSVTIGSPLDIGPSSLKWYQIAEPSETIPAEIDERARGYLKSLDSSATASWGDLGFVILHRCGREFYFLLVQTWRNNNELWESVYARRSDAEPDFGEFVVESHHRGTFCVWELAAVAHEKEAWRRFLSSSRTPDEREGYLGDQYSGPC